MFCKTGLCEVLENNFCNAYSGEVSEQPQFGEADRSSDLI